MNVAGRGITVGIRDSGILPHPDLNIVRDISGGGTHGTHVAGIVAASGSDGLNGNPIDATRAERGVAPAASVMDNPIDWDEDELNALVTNSVDAINESRGIDRDGLYNTGSQLRDEITAGDAGIHLLPYSVSAGNNGTGAQQGNQWDFFSPSKQVKNPFVVGNLLQNGSQVSPGSALGPFYDNRLAPTITAVGSNVVSTDRNGGVFDYDTKSGTSMASPMVTGTMALILEAYENLYLSQYGYSINSQRPPNSLTKAIIVNTADDLSGPQKQSDELID